MKENTLTERMLISYGSLLLGTAAVIYGLRFLWRVLIFGAAVRLSLLLRKKLYDHFTKQSSEFYQKRRIGDLMAHSTNDLQAIQQTAGDGVLTLVDSLMVGGFTLIAMAATISWKLTLISLIPMPFMAYATSRYGTMLHKRFHAAQEAFSSLNDKVQESISGSRVIKAFGQEEQDSAAFKELSADAVRKNMAVAKVDSLFDPTISLIVGLSFFLAVSFGALFVVQGEMSLGDLVSFTAYLGLLIWPMLAFGWLFNIVERGRASYDRVMNLLGTEEVIQDNGVETAAYAGDIMFKLDEFRYQQDRLPALKDIDFNLKEGLTLGITGKTGSGKTTLCRLLMREYDTGEGSIFLGGRDIASLTNESVKKLISYVPQDHFLFSASIRENIAFSRYDAPFSDVKEAAERAAVHEDIAAFKEGYETVVGERGVMLSGGQKQRLSIARAILHGGDVLILDDSLSAVDAKTEEKILNSLKSSRSGKTTVITAHRLSSIAHADWIIVLDEGRAIQQGTPEQLKSVDGWYKDTLQKQALESLIAQGG
jgi:ATP-binding cassette subfamily B protein